MVRRRILSSYSRRLGRDCARREHLTRLAALVLGCVSLAAAIAGCGGGHRVATTTHTSPARPRTRTTGIRKRGAIRANFYVSETATGDASGSSCANTLPYTWFNDAANWGTGAGQVGPGTVVGLCGTISSGLVVRGSGTAGDPITVYWEPGATMSAPDWGGGDAVYVANVSDVTFDGGDNGVSVEATAAGSGLPDQGRTDTAFAAPNCNGCTFENLTIANLYRHSARSDTSVDQTQVNAFGWYGSNVTIANNTIHDAGWAISAAWRNGDSANFIYGNDVYNSDHDFVAAPQNGSTVSGIYVYDNHFHDYANWDTGNADVYHHDGIHCFGGSDDIYHGFYIFDNRFDGAVGANATGQIFMEGGTSTPCSGAGSSIYIFNNVITSTDQVPSNSYLGTAAIQGAVVNNTVVGHDNTTNLGGCMGYSYQQPGQSVAFENNLASTCDTLMSQGGHPDGVFKTGSPDYNVYVNGGINSFAAGCGFYNFSQFAEWQSCLRGTGTAPGYDQHSIVISSAEANLKEDLSPGPGSRAIGAGANLTGMCNSLPAGPIPVWPGGVRRALCTTYTGPPLGGGAGSSTGGVTRPTSGGWTAGAY